MAYTTQYIGSRYVPLFAEPAEWNSARTYEPLTIVMHEGNSYTSRQYVPVGIEITNEKFWALTGNYNAQVEAYRREVRAILPLDNTPTDGSTKGVTSAGIYNAINTINNKNDTQDAQLAGTSDSGLKTLIEENANKNDTQDAQLAGTSDSGLKTLIEENANKNDTQDAQLAGTSDSGLKTLIEENAVYKPYNEESTDVGNSENRKFYTHDSLVHTNKTYGNYNNAVTSYFGANVDNNLAPVLGTNTQDIFSYGNIDSVCLVAQNDGLNIQWLANPNTYTINNNTISFNDATIKPGIGSYIALIDSNSFDIKVSDIKILAKIIAINDNVYTVDGWFDSSGTTTPSTSYYVLVNPLTKIWATNFNFSNPNNKTLSGTGCEVGIFNENSNFNADIGGVDVYNAKESAEYAFRAHSRINTIDKGLDTTNCNKVINAYGTPQAFTELIHSTRTDKSIPYIKKFDGSDSYRGLIKNTDPTNDNWQSFIKLSTATSYDLSNLHDGQELYIAAGGGGIKLNCGTLASIFYTFNNETKVAKSNMKFNKQNGGYIIFHIFGMESRAYIESVTNGTFISVDS